VDDLRDPAQAALVAGVLAAAREHGLATMLADRAAGAEPDRTGLLDFVAFGVAGVVVVPGPGNATEYLGRYGIPTVELPLDPDQDAAAAGRDAVERLAGGIRVGRATRTN
jgi:DNA-binding LacI/PurR family transcriptional regulator